MSLATFKKKSVVISGTNISGKPVYQYFLPSGPFGNRDSITSDMLITSQRRQAVSGFSLNGPYRNLNLLRKSIGTPYRGPYAKGNGGSGGRYYNEPVYNVNLYTAERGGSNNQFNKNSTVSTYAMLRRKYRYLYSGKYPNYWVQPNYGSSNLSDNKSQGMYVQNLTATYSKVVDTNDEEKYLNYIKNCSLNVDGFDARLCSNRTIIKPSTFHYTKFLHIPQSASQYTTRIQRKCVNPLNYQRPFPGPTNGGTCNSTYETINPIFVDKKIADNLNNLGETVIVKDTCT